MFRYCLIGWISFGTIAHKKKYTSAWDHHRRKPSLRLHFQELFITAFNKNFPLLDLRFNFHSFYTTSTRLYIHQQRFIPIPHIFLSPTFTFVPLKDQPSPEIKKFRALQIYQELRFHQWRKYLRRFLCLSQKPRWNSQGSWESCCVKATATANTQLKIPTASIRFRILRVLFLGLM